jgi:5-methylcytosine-specific restriction enzyme A
MTRHRIEFTTKIKLAAFQRAKGRCEECRTRIISAEYDHRIAWAMGGESTLENCVCLCAKCHRLKTSSQDIPQIAKAKRREAKHIGATKPKQKIQSRGFGQFTTNTKQTSVRF